MGIDVAIPATGREITLIVKDVDNRITDPHGHGDWLNAGFVTGSIECSTRRITRRAPQNLNNGRRDQRECP
jgi:hypothetical protein